MLVSVVMPVYNAAQYLREAVQSLIDQTYTKWELIAVDDGSTDDSWSILQSLDDTRIKTFQRKNGGQCAATNTGLQHISGDLVLFFDADDLMDARKIEAQVHLLSASPDSVSVGRWAFFMHDISDVKFKEEPIYFSGPATDWLYKLWATDTMMPNHGYMIPRRILEKAGTFYDEGLLLNIDFEYFTRIILNAESVVYAADSVCYYRKGVATAKTYKPKLEKRLSALEARKMAIQYLLGRDNSPEARQAAQMSLTILTFSFPEIRPFAKKVLAELGLGSFASFGGARFNTVSSLIGFENTIRLKEIYQKVI